MRSHLALRRPADIGTLRYNSEKLLPAGNRIPWSARSIDI